MTRFLFQRSLGFVYLVAFLIAFNQFRALCGDHGILPARLFLKRVDFWDAPSLFWIRSSDTAFAVAAGAGVILSFLAMIGVTDMFSTWVSATCWFALWLLYISFVNVGQTFYGFGWEILLLETGFLAIFMGSTRSPPQPVLFWLLRWLEFRVMFGAGMIKMRGDSCWRDLTCMFYHYETQPLPGPLSRSFAHFPEWIQKASVLFTHFTELVVPFGYFAPGMIRYAAVALTLFFQFTLILSGNLSWLNIITMVIAIGCLDDGALLWLGKLLPAAAAGGAAQVAGMPNAAVYAFALLVLALSIKPALNLVSSRQIMNTSFDPLHIVNTYGAFGSITRVRHEIIIEGTADALPDDAATWRPYEFRGKPGDPLRTPPQVTPYHYKIDWQMWFAAMSEYYYNPWILNFVAKLLEGNKDVIALLRTDPFPSTPPKFIRAQLYEYHFTKAGEPGVWNRRLLGAYLPPLSLQDARFHGILKEQGWLE